ncbi:hypothetical protein AUK22_03025 [bacterium CG2_30_54_10]|nr:MAG: hypothetical protein AUK22_03025 [bacterium CG2_30_54_10]
MKKLRFAYTFFLLAAICGSLGCLSTESPSRGGLRGTVTDSAGKLLSGVRVSTGGSNTYTDTNGEWLIESLEPQIFSVIAEKEGYESLSKTVEVLSGQTVESVNFSLAEKGSLYGVTASTITSSGVTITFYSRESSTSWVEYGPNTQYGSKTSQTATGSLLHQVILTGLTPSTTYHFRCFAIDPKGRSLSSDDNTFTTQYTTRADAPQDVAAVKAVGVDAIIVSWAPDTGGDLSGYFLYRGYSPAGPFTAVGGDITLNTSYTDTAVNPGEKLYYRVTKVSGSGEESPPSQVVSFLLPGIVRTNLVWTSESNPFVLSGDLLVREGFSLTMTRGVSVQVLASDQWDTDTTSDRKVEIKVQGTLNIEGFSEAPVTITSASPNPNAGDWIGITFDTIGNIDTSHITGLNLSFATDGLNGVRGLPIVTQSNVSFCSSSGVKCVQARQKVSLSNVTADGCSSGFLLASNTSVIVSVASCTAIRCFYGIVSRDNFGSEILGNKVQFWEVSGLDLGNILDTARAERNVVAPGSNGTAVVLRGNDQLRRNTLQGQIGIEIRGAARATIRSNLILADKAKNAIGVLYNGNAIYAPASHSIQANDVWNLPGGAASRYTDTTGAALTGISNDLFVDPALQGGSPFVEFPFVSFDYHPSSGSGLKGRGYSGDDIGAYDVPAQ